MRDEEREELEPSEQLMGTAESGVELSSIDDHPAIEVLESSQRNRRALHVLERRLELGLVSGSDETVRVVSGLGPEPTSAAEA